MDFKIIGLARIPHERFGKVSKGLAVECLEDLDWLCLGMEFERLGKFDFRSLEVDFRKEWRYILKRPPQGRC